MATALTPDLVWAVSNGIGAAAFGVTTLLLVTIEPHKRSVQLVIAACGINALWLAILALAPVMALAAPVLDLIETVRLAFWLALSVAFVPSLTLGMSRRWLALITAVLPVGIGLALAWHLSSVSWLGSPTAGHSFIFAIGATFMSLWGLTLVEQIWRAAAAEARWALKFLCLALVTMFGYDFLMYSFALIYAEIDVGVWAARGAVNAIAAPMIAIAVARNASWSPRLGLSRRAVFQTGTLLVAGLYLIFVAGGNYVIRHVGGTWSSIAAVLFVAASVVALLVVLLSGRMRASLRVRISKNLFRYRYDYREEWLALTRALSEHGTIDDPYEKALRAIAGIADCAGGALWVRRDDHFVCVSAWSLAGAKEIVEPADTLLLNRLHEREWIIDLLGQRQGGSEDERLALPESMAILKDVRLLMPLLAEQRMLGFVVLAKSRAPYRLDWEELDLLKTVGRQVGVFIDQQESNVALAESRQFEAFNRLTAFLMHDLKNIAGQQSLMLQNAERHKHNPAFVDDMILTIESSVTRMSQVLGQLQRVSLQSPGQIERVIVQPVIAALAREIAGLPKAVVAETASASATILVDRERLRMVLRHVIRNAQDACAESGNVRIDIREQASNVLIEIADDGEGMTSAFIRDSLFKPFESTKSSRGMGIGAYQARDFARAAGGDVAVSSAPGQGTWFTLVLPVAPDVLEPAVDLHSGGLS